MFSKKQIFLAGVLLTSEAKQLRIKPHKLSIQKINGHTFFCFLLTVRHSEFDALLITIGNLLQNKLKLTSCDQLQK